MAFQTAHPGSVGAVLSTDTDVSSPPTVTANTNTRTPPPCKVPQYVLCCPTKFFDAICGCKCSDGRGLIVGYAAMSPTPMLGLRHQHLDDVLQQLTGELQTAFLMELEWLEACPTCHHACFCKRLSSEQGGKRLRLYVAAPAYEDPIGEIVWGNAVKATLLTHIPCAMVIHDDDLVGLSSPQRSSLQSRAMDRWVCPDCLQCCGCPIMPSEHVVQAPSRADMHAFLARAREADAVGTALTSWTLCAQTYQRNLSVVEADGRLAPYHVTTTGTKRKLSSTAARRHTNSCSDVACSPGSPTSCRSNADNTKKRRVHVQESRTIQASQSRKSTPFGSLIPPMLTILRGCWNHHVVAPSRPHQHQ